MKTLLPACAAAALILSFTLSLADAARAQNTPAPPSSDSNSSTVVPLDHWAYQALYAIQQAGIAVVDPKGPPIGQIPMTRHDFAEAIADSVRLLGTNSSANPDLVTKKEALEGKIEGNQQALDALLSLTDEFAPDLKAIGVDVPGARARLHELEARLAVLEEEQRRVKVSSNLNFIARGIEPSSTDTKPLDKNGYRIVSAGSHASKNTHTLKHRSHKRAVHSWHDRHRRKIQRIGHRS